MKRLILICIAILCLITTVAFGADRQVTVTRVEQEVQPLALAPQGATGACVMGNPNPAYYAIPDWIWGAESYKYMFYADPAGCSACPAGFTVEAVHMYVQFGTEDVPVTFDASVDFEEGAWDASLSCWTPGPEICTSPAYTVTIDTPGLYDISLPMSAGDCACAYFGYWYGVSLTFLTAFDSTPDAITDNALVGCTSWNDYGLGWTDLNDFGFPGELIMFADIACCEDPVGNDVRSFGDIKALFR